MAIVDLMLPDMSGLELLHDWRTNWWLGMQDVPVVVLSGRSEDPDRAAAEVLGAALYLVKPVDPVAVAEHVRDILDEHKPQVFRSPVSGLPGASALDEEIGRRQAAQRPRGMLTLELMGMTTLNERQGYRRGDQAIRMLAATLSSGREAHTSVFHTAGARFVQVLDAGLLETEAAAAFQGFRLFQGWLDDSSAAGAGRTVPALQPEVAVHLDLAAAGLEISSGGWGLAPDALHELAGELLAKAKRHPGRLVKRMLD